MNTDILGISEIKWTGIGEFNSYQHYIYYCGIESLRKKKTWSIPHSQQKSPKCIFGIQYQKQQNDLGKTFNIPVIQVYAPTTNAEKA